MSLRPLLVLVPVAFSTGVLLPLTRSGLFTQCTCQAPALMTFLTSKSFYDALAHKDTLKYPSRVSGKPRARKNCHLTLRSPGPVNGQVGHLLLERTLRKTVPNWAGYNLCSGVRWRVKSRGRQSI